MSAADKDEAALLDFEEEEGHDEAVDDAGAADKPAASYAGVHSSGFKDFLLKPELTRAITECGFEHPSEVQHEAIPQAMLGMDVLCQAKSGMGKTAVFVLTTLNQLVAKDGDVSVLVLAHTRELAYQIGKEYERFSKFLPGVKTAVLYGGVPRSQQVKMLAEEKPHIVVGSPGRVMDLAEGGELKVGNVKFFVVDECDKVLDSLDMRRTVQKVFMSTPQEKQVMMFTATLAEEMKTVASKFMVDPLLIAIEDQTKLTLHGLQQYFCKLTPAEKTRKLIDLLDALDFNQVVVFVSSAPRARELNKLLLECNFPSAAIAGRMPQKERLQVFNDFRNNKFRILVATGLFGRGIDIESVNVVIHYDFPVDTEHSVASDEYLHRSARCGRFSSKGLVVSFISGEGDEGVLEAVQKRFVVAIPELPDTIDASTYTSA